MASYMSLRGISKENAKKHDWVEPGLQGKGIPNTDVILTGEHFGFFKIDWLGPRSGWLQEGLEKHIPQVWSSQNCYVVTKEQLLGVLKVSREVGKRRQEDMRDPDYLTTLLGDYDELEKILNEFDWETNLMFAYEQ